MISHLPLRLAASAFTLAIVLQPAAARCLATPLGIGKVVTGPDVRADAAKLLVDFLAS